MASCVCLAGAQGAPRQVVEGEGRRGAISSNTDTLTCSPVGVTGVPAFLGSESTGWFKGSVESLTSVFTMPPCPPPPLGSLGSMRGRWDRKEGRRASRSRALCGPRHCVTGSHCPFSCVCVLCHLPCFFKDLFFNVLSFCKRGSFYEKCRDSHSLDSREGARSTPRLRPRGRRAAHGTSGWLLLLSRGSCSQRSG